MTFSADEPKTKQLGIPKPSQGMILQRGGEELALEKTSDRFTIGLTSPQNNFPSAIPNLTHQAIPRTNLEEVQVAADELETAMATAREDENVAFASHVYQLRDHPETLVYLSDEITIQFIPKAEEEVRKTVAVEYSLVLVKPVKGIANTFVYRLTPDSPANPIKITNLLMGKAEVVTAEVDIITPFESFYTPSDSKYNQQWYLHHNGGTLLAQNSHIDVEKAWDITRGMRSVVVAIMDDAIDINHPDFQGEGKIVAPRDFKDKDFLPMPESSQESHGTACAGVAVAEENGNGVVGVAPGCALMPIRTSGYLDDRSIEDLFDWAVDNGADVISCSWGAAAVYFPLSLRQKATLNHAATEGRDGKGCVILFAAGNANRPVSGTIYERGWQQNVLSGPTKWLNGFAVHPDVIAVSACSSLNRKSAYSNWGANISVSAPSNNAPPGIWFRETGYIGTAPQVTAFLPGRGIFTTDQLGELGYNPDDFTRTFGGTSSACPVVAGVAGLIISANPDLTAQEVKQILQQSADKVVDTDPDPQLGLRMGTYANNGHSQWFGYGKVNAFKAVQRAQRKLGEGGAVSRRITASNNLGAAIPDNDKDGLDSTISVRERGTIKDIQVTVDITHEFLGDIEVNLIAPNGKKVLLQSRTLGGRNQLKATYYLESTPALKQLLQQITNGIWRLRVIDHVLGDTGRLNGWSLSLGI